MKKFLTVFTAALMLSLSACGSEETEQTVTEQTVQTTQSTITAAVTTWDAGIETLAEGEERDYKIEDILKNDLTIDGIPVSIPCTLNEFLDALGDDYSVKKSEIKDYLGGEANTKTRDYVGDATLANLYYDGEILYRQIHLLALEQKVDYDNIIVVGYMGGGQDRKGCVRLPDLVPGDSVQKCIEVYGAPDEVGTEDKEIEYLKYKDDYGFLFISIENDVIYRFWPGLKSEDLDD